MILIVFLWPPLRRYPALLLIVCHGCGGGGRGGGGVVVRVSESRGWPSVTRKEKKGDQHRQTCLQAQIGQFDAGEAAMKTLIPFLAGQV